MNNKKRITRFVMILLIGILTASFDNKTAYAMSYVEPMRVFGPDTRQIVRQPECDVNYSPIGRITSFFPDGTMMVGTGFLIGNDLIATAAHVVFMPEHGGYATDYSMFVPADNSVEDGGNERPYGTANLLSNHIHVPRQYRDPDETARENYDYALVRIDRAIGVDSRADHFDMRVVRSGDFLSENINITGYPGEAQGRTTRSMWTATGAAMVLINQRRVTYRVPTSAGQSGAPIVLASDPRAVIGIHTMGRRTSPEYNSGVIMTEEVYNFLRSDT